MAFLPMGQAPTTEQDLIAHLLRAQQASAGSRPPQGQAGQAFYNLGDTLTNVLGSLAMADAQETQQGQLAQLLMGTPAQPGSQPALPGAQPGDIQGFLPGQPAQPGLMGDMDPRMIQAMLLQPGGREAMMQAAVQRAMPEPISPYQQASLDLQQQQVEQRGSEFDQSHALDKAQMDATVAYQNAKLKLDAAELGAGGQIKLSDIAGIRKEYTDASGDFVKMRDAFGKIQAAGRDVSPAGDLGLIYNYMRMLDPGSTVRESEFAQVAASGALGERFVGWARQLMTGQRLTDFQRSDVLAQSANTMRSQLGHQLRSETAFGNLAEEFGVPRRHVTPDLIGDLREGVPDVERLPESAAQSAIGSAVNRAGEALGFGDDGAPVGDVGGMSLDQLTRLNPATMTPEQLRAAARRYQELGQ